MTIYTRRLSGVPLIPLLYPNFGKEERDAILFMNNAFREIKDSYVQITDDPAKADYLLLAHNFSTLRKCHDYVAEFEALSKKYGKKIIVFWHGDRDDQVPLSNTVVFRTSMYGQTKHPEEIAMPAYAEDLLQGEALQIRKKAEIPTVGFCGWADYRSLRNRIGTYVQNATVDAQALLTAQPLLRARRKGLSFRRAAITSLQCHDNVSTNFIIRSSYSGHSDTIKLNPVQARKEYRDNMLQSDLALSVKGDGNFSYRFYEALSLGRIPLLIDTDCVLPLSDKIDYDSFILRVPFTDIARLPERVEEWWRRLNDEGFEEMQKKVREAYETYVAVPAFLKHAVNSICS
ncbi:hypothetical protein A3C37_01675 [Candidatus Peribacteria bacterium RIFCSPHIGHO2_02_FULL_53_20]|nr:MAG: hypothetical protein A3C37_01675 [Candidatus Peribacteria bacterium RIFCSPHIGHO2_02_FULL_53_20]OGJ67687.1 MAG: hypothetical protein A3B61_05390 [Candidatus Peribacteria bacterium RIFCSPLOWO2_01_FULL_53_10]OGJ70069.1 MAG: hypothetical protein A3G69_02910 [Candidatus Peribacteria bacterium RIFCSPLOWO2_12_FULL_53_10]